MTATLTRFTSDVEAARIHGIGRNAELAGDFDKAIRVFACGIERLSTVHDGRTNPHNLLQLMGIERDLAFTLVRQGLAEEDDFSIVRGRQIIEGVLSYGHAIDELAGNNYSRRAARHRNAEVGATQGVLARTLTVEFVNKLDVDTPKSPADIALKAAQNYRQAAILLANGSNRYFEASNAANFARHLRAVEESGVAHWLGVAAASTATATFRNPRNFPNALGTTAHRALAIDTPDTARASVIAKP